LNIRLKIYDLLQSSNYQKHLTLTLWRPKFCKQYL